MKVSWDDEILNIWKKMFQTTNLNYMLLGNSSIYAHRDIAAAAAAAVAAAAAANFLQRFRKFLGFQQHQWQQEQRQQCSS